MALKDSIKRRTHKERAQPAARRKYGLLEKKKDYILRAKDFHKKEETIKTLKRKAEERNPDEFYFAMENARTKNGAHIVPTSEPNKYSQEQLRLMKTQDVGYLKLKTQAEKKKIEKMQQSLHMLGVPVKRQHVVFVEDESELVNFDAAEYFDTPNELLDRTYNRPKNSQLEDPSILSTSLNPGSVEGSVAKNEKRRLQLYKELLQRREREGLLTGAMKKMEYEKLIMGKGRKRKLRPEEAGGKSGVYRWKMVRKK